MPPERRAWEPNPLVTAQAQVGPLTEGSWAPMPSYLAA